MDDLIKKWEICLNRKDLDGMIELYAKDAILWGTFSEIIRDKHELIREYFQQLFIKNELNVRFSKTICRNYMETTIVSGLYEFSYTEENLITHPARFTFVICNIGDGKFKIVEHHSSLLP